MTSICIARIASSTATCEQLGTYEFSGGRTPAELIQGVLLRQMRASAVPRRVYRRSNMKGDFAILPLYVLRTDRRPNIAESAELEMRDLIPAERLDASLHA